MIWTTLILAGLVTFFTRFSMIAKVAKENHIQVVGSFYEKSKKNNRVNEQSMMYNVVME